MELLAIGRFARMTGLTVRAVRHYGELGLLNAAHVDPETGYRYFAPEQRESLTTDGPPREIYVTSPVEISDPADWVTEIQFPIARDEARIAALAGTIR